MPTSSHSPWAFILASSAEMPAKVIGSMTFLSVVITGMRL